MAKRYRRRYGGGRDLFPTQVAAVGLVVLALLGALVVWTLLPEDDASREALAREEADRASFGLPRDTAPAPRAEQSQPTRDTAAAPTPVAAPAPSLTPPTAANLAPEGRSPEPAAQQAPAPNAQLEDRRLAQVTPSPREEVTAVSDARYSAQRASDRPRESQPVTRDSTPRRRPPSTPPARPTSSGERMTLFTAGEANAAGQQALAAGNAREAVIHFQRATTLEPADAAYRTSYASALLRTGDASSAVRQLEQVLRDNHRLPGVWALLGEARLARGDTAGARFAYGRYVELERDPRLRAQAQARVERLRSNF